MELVLVLVVAVVVGALIYFNRSARSLDINQDGRVDAADAVAAVARAAEGVKSTVKKVATRTKSSANKTGAKQVATRKPRAIKK